MDSSWVQTPALTFTTHDTLVNEITVITLSLGYCEDEMR